MRLKLLLLTLMLSGGILFAQEREAYRQLIFTEAMIGQPQMGYFEITNVGNQPVQLGEFEIGAMTPWDTPPWNGYALSHFMLPEHILNPGESYVIGGAYEWEAAQFAKGLNGYGERGTKEEIWKVADFLVYAQETNEPPPPVGKYDYYSFFWTDMWGGRDGWYLEQHLSETDSVVVDQVNQWGDNENGMNYEKAYDIAGVKGASGNSYLIRKAVVKQGNLDFASAAGVGEDDGEWIVVNVEGDVWRDLPWSVGNHGSYVFNENTLQSNVAGVNINFAAKTITVPWGTLRGDGIMDELLVKKPGILWNYICSPVYEDSASFAAKTGDTLLVVVCGDKGYKEKFAINVSEPTNSANIVVQKANISPEPWWRTAVNVGMLGWPRITRNASGNDTIWGERGGIPYATRVDSLLKVLEKPTNAEWEIVFANGIPSPDLKNGDKLKVIAQNKAEKLYYISVLPLRESYNSFLSSITFPDLPKEYQGALGWIGDTIPNFAPSVFNYRIEVPLDIIGIPALVGKAQDANSKVAVKRATNINGTLEDRTITFTVTAADDTTKNTYKVELVKEKDPANLQPFYADPFLSEYVFADQWRNHFAEICNPGNQPLDLSNYMIAAKWNTDAVSVIETGSGAEDSWANRYTKYVPGYKWVNEAQWAVTPGILEPDLNVNPWVMPGDVFAFGWLSADWEAHPDWIPGYKWPVPDQLDVNFYNGPLEGSGKMVNNPWNEEVPSSEDAPVGKWSSSDWYMYKILNDSVQRGLKPANDPNDFELIERFGMADWSNWVVDGHSVEQLGNWIRDPNTWKPNPEIQGSNVLNDEWTYYNDAYWSSLGYTWPDNILMDGANIGQHFFNPPTHYMSTVSSVVYKVSSGYSAKEKIRGLVTGTTAASFIGNLIKGNEGQTLTVKGTGGVVEGTLVVNNNDTLVVMSADSTNTTRYLLEVTDGGLSRNAIITSSLYTVTIDKQPKSAGNEDAGEGNVTGFEYGTSLRTVLANITVPDGASFDVIDINGSYVPLQILNYDTTLVQVTVTSNVYLSVTAENGVTQIVYQLLPSVADHDAFILSNVYDVVQKDFLIRYVPRGTDVGSFLANLFPSTGATMKLLNKAGQERADGGVADDDKVVVTSKDGSVSNVYHISKLATKYVPETTYLAYILSKVYAIDQVVYKVAGVSGTETVSAFLSKVTASQGATPNVVDKNNNIKTSGDINNDDRVMVTSADGKMIVYYTFGQLTSASNIGGNNIELYPNPTHDIINVSGLKAGYHIQVYNSVGVAIREVSVQNSIERISLKNQPAGMYLIVIRDNNKMLGRYKALRQ